MAKYRITEEQLQKIFEKLEMNRLKEVDSNYPPGSDTSDAPWNRTDSPMSDPIKASGDYKLVSVVSGEYLIQSSNDLLYTMDEIWERNDGKGWVDIKDQLEDFLEIPQEEEENEDGKY